jgi:hypothetical protein
MVSSAQRELVKSSGGVVGLLLASGGGPEITEQIQQKVKLYVLCVSVVNDF